MLAINPDERDVDLSHLSAQVAYAISPEASQATKKSLRYLVLGLIVSCTIHTVMLLVNWRQGVVAPKKSESTTLSIQLQTLPTPEPVAEEVAPAPIAEITPTQQVSPTSPPPEDSIQQPEIPETQASETKASETKAIGLKPLTAEELRDIIQSNNSAHQTTPTGGIATNVFHPGLRQRLQEEERKPELQRADAGPKTHTDPSGATIVDLGGGKCLRSSVPKLGQVQNWYMTSCGGTSESEQIMERVNNAVNGKLRFEE
ncbi:hypothetical protein [Cellvibrio sp. pealriver]|uniref:hypothetical protein n=1 Tax=Cellvibrio sp. pealriver TaxID=1622269 RepID=UPI00066FF664|nr:hypothetical protein [Cellvibrio sp. pealriver]